MLNKPKILVCSDLSESSDAALKSAGSMVAKVGGEIHVLHVSEVPIQWDWVANGASALLITEAYFSDHVRAIEKLLNDQVKRCEIQAATHVKIGFRADGILQHKKKINADLIIMGNHSEKHSWYLGNTVSKVLMSSDVPVLVTRKALETSLQRVAGLIDSNDRFESIESAVEELAFLMNAEPEVISLWHDNFSILTIEDKEEIENGIREKINKGLAPGTKCRVRIERSSEGTLAYHMVKILEEEKVDLVVMKRHQKKLLEKLLIGSETRRMLEIYQGNILVLPPNK